MAKKKTNEPKVTKIKVKNVNDVVSDYLWSTALDLQRQIVNSGFYIGSDYKLYKLGNNPLDYTQNGVIELVRLLNG